MPVAWDKFAPEVTTQVKGAPPQLVEDAIRDATIEFAANSTIARHSLAKFDVTGDKKSYTLSPPANTRVVVIHYASIDGMGIEPISEDHLDWVAQNWREGGQVTHRFFQPDPHTIELPWNPPEDITEGFFVRVSLKPTRDADELADELDIIYEDWHRAVAVGAMSRLLGMSDVAWADHELAEKRRNEFEGAIAQGHSRAKRSHTRRGGRVRFRPFVRGGGRGF